MIKIAISGIKGRMGSSIYNCLSEESGLELVCATTLSTDSDLGKSVSEVLGGKSPVILSDQLNTEFDILIDFTSVASSLSHLAFCQKHQKAIVIGTTGFDQSEIEQIDSYAKDIAVFRSANMSLGVNVMQKLVAMASRALHECSDIEIIEAHHKHKVDAPSGTALMLGETVAETLGISLSNKGVFSRHGITGEREEGSIGFSTIRGGDVVGEHSVMYYMQGERVEISHKATNRKIFARGAIFAAKFLSSKDKGVYNMFDALSLD